MKVEPFASSIILMWCIIPIFQFILLIELEFNNVLDIMQKVDNTYSSFTITANILRYYTSRLYHKIDNKKTVLQRKLQHRMSLIKLTR